MRNMRVEYRMEIERGTKMVSPNSEIIRQLYLETTANIRRDSGYRTFQVKFTQFTFPHRSSSLKTFGTFFSAVKEAFPDFVLNIDSLVTKGDRVMARYTISGTHKGNFLGLAPTHQKTTISGIDLFRLNDGKVVEHWDAAHQISILPRMGWKRLGAVRQWRNSPDLVGSSSL